MAGQDEGRRTAVTGIGVVSPLGCKTDLFWRRLLDAESGIAPIARWDASWLPIRFGGECREFDLATYQIDARKARRLDRFAQFALGAAIEAVNDSGLDFQTLDPSRCGVIVGSGVGGLETIQEQYRTLLEKGPRRMSPLGIPRLMPNAASAALSIRYGLRGLNSCVATACSTGANAVADAAHAVRRGQCDAMIAGGAEAALCEFALGSFSAAKALSKRNDDPEKASRPWDRDRDGFVLSEGSAVLVLEEMGAACARGARIYAELAGSGNTADAFHVTAPREDGRGAAEAIRSALRDARLDADQIDYINAHGTGTPLGDLAETSAIRKAFGPHADRLMVSSSKSQFGHLIAASGALSAAVSALALHSGHIPPTINLDNPGPGCNLDYVPHTSRQVPIRHAMCNSFGFGGHNTCLILSRV